LAQVVAGLWSFLELVLVWPFHGLLFALKLLKAVADCTTSQSGVTLKLVKELAPEIFCFLVEKQ